MSMKWLTENSSEPRGLMERAAAFFRRRVPAAAAMLLADSIAVGG